MYNFNLAQFMCTTKRLVIIFCICTLDSATVTAETASNQLESELKKFIAITERHYLIPTGLLDAVARVESEYNPYALNVAGRKVIAKTKTEAAYVIRQVLDKGIMNVDIGIVQVNYRWHKENFAALEEMLDPKSNIRYGATLLLALRRQYGSWHEAIKRYHSGNEDLNKKYSRKIMVAWMQSK